MSVGKGGRTAKDFKVARNRNSLQGYFRNEYLGSVGEKELCLFIAEKCGTKHKLEKTQSAAIGEEGEKTQKAGQV